MSVAGSAGSGPVCTAKQICSGGWAPQPGCVTCDSGHCGQIPDGCGGTLDCTFNGTLGCDSATYCEAKTNVCTTVKGASNTCGKVPAALQPTASLPVCIELPDDTDPADNGVGRFLCKAKPPAEATCHFAADGCWRCNLDG